MTNRHEYTVCFLFDNALQKVLLAHKNATDFAGRLNGVGGELEPEEQAYKCAAREIREETGICTDDLKDLGLQRLIQLGTLSLPYDCKYKSGSCVLHFFAGIVKPGVSPYDKTDKDEELVWEPVTDILNSNVRSYRYAGGGDLQYFVNAAVEKLTYY